LRKLVERYRGRLVSRHWTHTLFRLFRRALGVTFELQVLVIAELIGTAYYRLLEKQTSDLVIRQVCELVLRDEARHIAFHAERFAASQAAWLPFEKALWLTQFQALFLAALQVAWMDHCPALRVLRISCGEFQREARHECVHFLASFAGALASPRSVPSPTA
jgi:hypothetical protein